MIPENWELVVEDSPRPGRKWVTIECDGEGFPDENGNLSQRIILIEVVSDVVDNKNRIEVGRLIAVAPQMLMALKECVPALEECGEAVGRWEQMLDAIMSKVAPQASLPPPWTHKAAFEDKLAKYREIIGHAEGLVDGEVPVLSGPQSFHDPESGTEVAPPVLSLNLNSALMFRKYVRKDIAEGMFGTLCVQRTALEDIQDWVTEPEQKAKIRRLIKVTEPVLEAAREAGLFKQSEEVS